ncbi:Non-specific serine/threonine protein kinase [Bertholletia excelsa]
MQWKQGYSMRKIEAATNRFADENVIGSGDHGIVYRGVVFDGTRVAVKKLLCGSGNGEEFLAQVKAVGGARHRNLVNLLGCCVDGASRILVYEYVDKGNLYDWLHGYIRDVSPPTWAIRMNIIQSVAKCLAYLHEDIEPIMIHGRVKSSNVLLDHQWNPKVSDLGVAQVLGSEWTQVKTSSFGMFGYTAPEYAHTGKLDEKTDVYSFGVLLMEIITGKTPLDYYTIGTEEEVSLLDWLKSMVSRQHLDCVLDPREPDPPSMKELKRAVLIALRCVDPDTENRPRMGEVIQMFEPRDLLLSGVRRNCFFRLTNINFCEFCVRHRTFHSEMEGQTGGEGCGTS